MLSLDMNSRISEQQKRYNLISGSWEYDVSNYYKSSITAPERRDAMGKPITSFNPYKSVVMQLSTLYMERPSVIIKDDEVSSSLINYLDLFKAHQAIQQYANAMGEMFIQVKPNTKNNTVYYEHIAPMSILKYKCEVGSNTDIVYLERLLREVKTVNESAGNRVMYVEVWDVNTNEPDLFMFRVEKRTYNMRTNEVDSVELVTSEIYPEYDGNYPYINVYTNEPFVPFIVYHKLQQIDLWNSKTLHELVDLTYSTSIEWTMQSHATKNASFRQKYTLDAEVQVQRNAIGEGTRAVTVADPASVVQFSSVNQDRPGSIGTFDASMDPLLIADAIIKKSAEVYKHLNIDSLQYSVTEAQSGVALQIKKESLDLWRKEQARTFEISDRDFIYKAMLIMNAFSATNIFPNIQKGDINIEYIDLVVSQEQIDREAAALKEEYEMGLISKIDLIARKRGISREEAIQHLMRVAEDEKLLREINGVNAVDIGSLNVQ